MISNLYLKFSKLQLLSGENQPFSNIYGATSSVILTEYLSPQEIMDAYEEELLTFIAQKSKNRITDISKTTELLKKAARDSYRLDKCLYEPLNVSLASSFNRIDTFKKEIKAIDDAIGKTIKGIHPNALTILKSIDGIGPVFTAGIIAEIGDINVFHSSDALAKYAGHLPGQKINLVTSMEKTLVCKKLEILICAITLAKPPTVSEDTLLSIGTTTLKNTAKFRNISTKEYSR